MDLEHKRTFYQYHVFICHRQKEAGKPCCGAVLGDSAVTAVRTALAELSVSFRVQPVACLGRCRQGPCCVIYPQGVWLRYETPEMLANYLREYCTQGTLPESAYLPDC